MLAVLLVLALPPQRLDVTPFPAEVGETVTVRASRGDQPLGGQAITVRGPDEVESACGTTGGDGTVGFVPAAPGQYVFVTEIAGVRVLAPHRVVPERRPWLAAFVCVPLGLALLWHNLPRKRRSGLDGAVRS